MNATPANATNLRDNKGWNGSVVVAPNFGSSTDFLYRSTDNGATWTSVANTTNWPTGSARQFTQSVAYGNGRFIAVAGQGNRNLSISTDGIAWPQLSVNFSLEEGADTIVFSRLKNKFIIRNITVGLSTGNLGVSVSTDGGTWTTTAIQSEAIRSIIETDLRIYAILSTSGTIVDITDEI